MKLPPKFVAVLLLCFAHGAVSPDALGAEPPTNSDPIPPTLITQPGSEFGHATRKWQGIPSIEISPGGRLWATWYGGPAGEGDPGNHQTLVTSGDDGKTWSDPVAVFQPGPEGNARCGDGHLWLDPQGRLWWVINRVSGEERAPPSGLGPRGPFSIAGPTTPSRNGPRRSCSAPDSA
jgi:hypothetical protein